jgi:tetratricopeptide (TPR) repeat protein
MLAPEPSSAEKQAEAAAAAGSDCRVGGSDGVDVCVKQKWPARFGAVLLGLSRRPRLWAVVVLLGLVAAGLAPITPRLRGWYHLRAARSDLQRYHNPQAVRHLRVCMHIWPEDPEVLILGARAARRARVYGDTERCLEMYQKSRGFDDAYNLEHLLLSAEQNVDRVADLCHRYLDEGHPDAPLILEALTRGYLRQFRLPDAYVCLERWRQTEPDNAQAFWLEGLFHLGYERGAQQAALESYRRAVELDPDHEEARLGLASAAIQSKLFAEAAEHLEYMRRCQPENLQVRVGLAECRYALGDQADALRLVEEVLAQQPQHPSALSLRGRLAVAAGQYAEAEPWLRQAVALEPGDHQARYNLILCLYQNNKEDEAQEQQQELKQREEDVERFNDIVTREMVQRPHDPALHCTLGRLLLRLHQNEEGLRWLHSALAQDPQYGPARQALAEYYQAARKKGQQPDPE